MTSLSAGFSKIDITPDFSIPLWWVIGERVATGVHWPLHARVALFDSGDRRVAIVALDVALISSANAAMFRTAMAGAGGLAENDILVSCTHTHSCPLRDYGPLHPDYEEPLASWLTTAMKEAASRLEPVELTVGSTTTRGLAFSRRPMYAANEVASGGPSYVPDFVGFEGPIDEELQLLLARRADGSVAGGLVGFACHPHIMGPLPMWSADFPGVLSERLGEHHGGTFLFLQGASGDIHWVDRSVDRWWTNWWVDPPALADEPRARAVECAERQASGLFAAAMEADAAMRPVNGATVAAVNKTLEIPLRCPTSKQVDLARWFMAQDPDSIDVADYTQRMSGHPFTFYENSHFIQGLFARLTVEMSEAQQQSQQQPPVEQVEVQVVSVGDVAFVAYPGEMFSDFALRTKAASPFATTFVCGVSNGSFAYVPTTAAFEHGGYETRIGSSPLAENAGDLMTDAALELLQGIAP